MLVDTSYLYFRAFHGLPGTLRSPAGEPVNAVRGVLDFLSRLISSHGPDRVVCCWDQDWRPQWRVDLLPSYKAHRVVQTPSGLAEDIPEGLEQQVPWIREALETLGLPVVGMPDAEADDVIGTLATRADDGALIVTGDRDLMQLVDDAAGIRVVWIAAGMNRSQVFDEAAVVERFGVPAEYYCDLAALRGDPSDGIPGVRGIGEKTATALIRAHGHLERIRAAADDPSSSLTPTQRRRIQDDADYLDVAPEVIRVRRDLPIPEPTATRDLEAFGALADRLGLGRSADRILDVADRILGVADPLK